MSCPGPPLPRGLLFSLDRTRPPVRLTMSVSPVPVEPEAGVPAATERRGPREPSLPLCTPHQMSSRPPALAQTGLHSLALRKNRERRAASQGGCPLRFPLCSLCTRQARPTCSTHAPPTPPTCQNTAWGASSSPRQYAHVWAFRENPSAEAPGAVRLQAVPELRGAALGFSW